MSGSLGYGVDVGFGKWIISTVAFRADASVRRVNKGYGLLFIGYGHFDVMFDIVSATRKRNPGNLRSYLLVGTGLAHSRKGDNDFCGVLGVGADWRIKGEWRLLGELSTIIHPYSFDDNSSASFLPSILVGLSRDINSNPYRKRKRNETREYDYDWAFQVAIGANSMNYRGAGSIRNRLKLLTPTIEFGIGKSFTKTWSARIVASGLYSKTRDELFSYYNLHGDIMLDVAGWMAQEKRLPLLDLKPYLGASYVARLDSQPKFLFGVAMGGVLAFRLDGKNEFYVDARYLFIPPRFAQVSQKQSAISVGLATLTIGYSYLFTNSSFR